MRIHMRESSNVADHSGPWTLKLNSVNVDGEGEQKPLHLRPSPLDQNNNYNHDGDVSDEVSDDKEWTEEVAEELPEPSLNSVDEEQDQDLLHKFAPPQSREIALEMLTSLEQDSQEGRSFGLGPAHKKLKRIISHAVHGRAVKVTALGGSVSAGGGNVPEDQRYFGNYVKWLKNIAPDADQITLVNSAQGGENSMYGALLFSAIIPADTDILFWEFAPNDRSISNGKKCCDETDMLFIQDLFLRRVAAMPNPPVVILVYTWSIPSHESKKSMIKDMSLQSTKAHAMNFPLVGGYVSLVEKLHRDASLPHFVQDVKKAVFADKAHPNEIGHAIMGNLLIQLTNAAYRSDAGQMRLKIDESSYPAPKWPCGEYGSFIENTLMNMRTSTAWTSLKPSLEDQQLPLSHFSANQDKISSVEGKLKTVLFGKTSPIRKDRKLFLELPCCSREEFLRFDFSSLPSQSALHFAVEETRSTAVFLSSTPKLKVDNAKREPVEDAMSWKTSCVVRNFPNNEFRAWVDLENSQIKNPKYAFLCNTRCSTFNTVRWFSVIERNNLSTHE